MVAVVAMCSVHRGHRAVSRLAVRASRHGAGFEMVRRLGRRRGGDSGGGRRRVSVDGGEVFGVVGAECLDGCYGL